MENIMVNKIQEKGDHCISLHHEKSEKQCLKLIGYKTKFK